MVLIVLWVTGMYGIASVVTLSNNSPDHIADITVKTCGGCPYMPVTRNTIRPSTFNFVNDGVNIIFGISP